VKDVYLHFGAHKSASTTIQRSLRRSQQYLVSSGIRFLGSADLHKEPIGEHFRNLARRDSLSESEYLESLGRAKRFWLDLCASIDEPKILISYEGFCGGSSLDVYGGIYRNPRRIAESVKEIFSGSNIRIIFVLRRQDEFVESCYLQQIKEGRVLEFSDFKNAIDPEKLRWNPMLDSFSEIFDDDFCVMPFELLKIYGKSKDFLDFFFRGLNLNEIEVSKMTVVEKANASMSAYAVGLHKEVVSKVSVKSRNTLRNIFASEFPSEKYGKARFFGQFERALILKYLRSHNADLFDTYLRRSSDLCGFELEDLRMYWFD